MCSTDLLIRDTWNHPTFDAASPVSHTAKALCTVLCSVLSALGLVHGVQPFTCAAPALYARVNAIRNKLRRSDAVSPFVLQQEEDLTRAGTCAQEMRDAWSARQDMQRSLVEAHPSQQSAETHRAYEESWPPLSTLWDVTRLSIYTGDLSKAVVSVRPD